jgi:hypothetical protein
MNTNNHGDGAPVILFPVEDVLIIPSPKKTAKPTTTANYCSSLSSSAPPPELIMLHRGQLKLDQMCRALFTHPAAWCKLVQLLEGRDNITKLLQYISRFGAWYYCHSSSSSQQVALRLTNLKTNLAQARKAFRLGRTFLELEKLYQLGLWNKWIKNSFMLGGDIVRKEKNDISNLIFNAVRLCGMAGFWAADNMAFLISSSISSSSTPADQSWKQLAERCGKMANRSYFCAAITNFYLNATAYLDQRRKMVQRQLLEQQRANIRLEDDDDDARRDEQRQEEQDQRLLFDLFLAVVKSTCDIMMFSNNPGVDLWQRHTGRKMHEGLHAACGIVSAGTVLVKYFPSSSGQ